MAPERLVELGRVVGAHGLRGQIRVRWLGDGPDNLLTVPSIWLGERVDDPAAQRFEVVFRGSGRAGEVRLGLAGIEDREAAGSLRGRLVLAEEDALEPLSEDEFYWHELVGCRVVAADAEREGEDGDVIGNVVEIWETGAHDLLVVEGESGERHLIPTAREFMREIDRETRTIRVAVIPGLLDGPKLARRDDGEGERGRPRAKRRSRRSRSREGSKHSAPEPEAAAAGAKEEKEKEGKEEKAAKDAPAEGD